MWKHRQILRLRLGPNIELRPLQTQPVDQRTIKIGIAADVFGPNVNNPAHLFFQQKAQPLADLPVGGEVERNVAVEHHLFAPADLSF